MGILRRCSRAALDAYFCFLANDGWATASHIALSILMALFPEVGILLFGVVTAVCFFVPGLKYHRQRRRKLEPQMKADKRG